MLIVGAYLGSAAVFTLASGGVDATGTITGPEPGTPSDWSLTDVSLSSSILPDLAVGNTSLAPSTDKQTTVLIPITLSLPAGKSVKVDYKTLPGSALAKSNYVSQSGTVTFSANSGSIKSVQQDVELTIPAQSLSSQLTFHLDLYSYPTSVNLNDAEGDINLLPNSNVPSRHINIGDASIYQPATGAIREIHIPVTLTSSASKTITVDYKTLSYIATSPIDFRAVKGSLTFPAGTVEKNIAVDINDLTNPVPNRIFNVTIASTSTIATASKSLSNDVIINGPNSGLILSMPSGYSSATLTPNRDPSTHLFDTFSVAQTSTTHPVVTDGLVMTGSANNTDTNSRLVFWPSDEQPSLTQETCAIWNQSPSNDSDTIAQEGLALRASTIDGITRAITITKNIYGSNHPTTGPHAVFDVILWDSSIPNNSFDVIGDTDLRTTFFAGGQYLPFPWEACAMIEGNTINFLVWPTDMSQPAWGTAGYGGTFTIPSADVNNWSQPGYAGWYFGHLSTTSNITYTDTTT
jgi:hypothetical protein